MPARDRLLLSVRPPMNRLWMIMDGTKRTGQVETVLSTTSNSCLRAVKEQSSSAVLGSWWWMW